MNMQKLFFPNSPLASETKVQIFPPFLCFYIQGPGSAATQPSAMLKS